MINKLLTWKEFDTWEKADAWEKEQASRKEFQVFSTHSGLTSNGKIKVYIHGLKIRPIDYLNALAN